MIKDNKMVKEQAGHPRKCQRNGYIVKWDGNRDKWAVCKKRYQETAVLEEFNEWTDAEKWCYEN